MFTFGEVLEKARLNKRITFRKLSELVGLSPSYISEIEKGRRQPPKDTEKLKNLSIVLGLDEKDLFEVAEKEKAKKKTIHTQ